MHGKPASTNVSCATQVIGIDWRSERDRIERLVSCAIRSECAHSTHLRETIAATRSWAIAAMRILDRNNSGRRVRNTTLADSAARRLHPARFANARPIEGLKNHADGKPTWHRLFC